MAELYEKTPSAASLSCLVVFSMVSWLSFEFFSFSPLSAYGCELSFYFWKLLTLASTRSIILIISAALFDSCVSIRTATLLEPLLVDYLRGFALRLVFLVSPKAELDLDPLDLLVESYLPDPALKRLDCLLLLSSLLL